MKRLKIYMAGPQCFYPNSEEVFANYCAIAEKYGCERCDTPADFSGANTPQKVAKAIFEANINSIKTCDVVIADINNFRGWEPDSGTSFEMGAAHVWGKPIYAYISDIRSCEEKLMEKEEVIVEEDGRVRDKEGIRLERGVANLMLTGSSVVVHGTFEDAVKRACEDLRGQEGEC